MDDVYHPWFNIPPYEGMLSKMLQSKPQREGLCSGVCLCRAPKPIGYIPPSIRLLRRASIRREQALQGPADAGGHWATFGNSPAPAETVSILTVSCTAIAILCASRSGTHRQNNHGQVLRGVTQPPPIPLAALPPNRCRPMVSIGSEKCPKRTDYSNSLPCFILPGQQALLIIYLSLHFVLGHTLQGSIVIRVIIPTREDVFIDRPAATLRMEIPEPALFIGCITDSNSTCAICIFNKDIARFRSSRGFFHIRIEKIVVSFDVPYFTQAMVFECFFGSVHINNFKSFRLVIAMIAISVRRSPLCHGPLFFPGIQYTFAAKVCSLYMFSIYSIASPPPCFILSCHKTPLFGKQYSLEICPIQDFFE